MDMGGGAVPPAVGGEASYQESPQASQAAWLCGWKAIGADQPPIAKSVSKVGGRLLLRFGRSPSGACVAILAFLKEVREILGCY